MSTVTEMEIFVIGLTATLTALLLSVAILFGSVAAFLLALWCGWCLGRAVSEFNRIMPRS